MWFDQPSGDISHRGGNGDGWAGTWKKLLDSINFKKFCTPDSIGAAASSHTHKDLQDQIDNSVKFISGSSLKSLSELRSYAEQNTTMYIGFLDWSSSLAPTSDIYFFLACDWMVIAMGAKKKYTLNDNAEWVLES